MLRIKIELDSAITGKTTTIATAQIVNTGTGDSETGNYKYRLYNEAGELWKSGRVEGFPRQCLLAFDLLYRALKDAIGGRNGD